VVAAVRGCPKGVSLTVGLSARQLNLPAVSAPPILLRAVGIAGFSCDRGLPYVSSRLGTGPGAVATGPGAPFALAAGFRSSGAGTRYWLVRFPGSSTLSRTNCRSCRS